jgi:diguanylate cyclase (GGDEF)-like protein
LAAVGVARLLRPLGALAAAFDAFLDTPRDPRHRRDDEFARIERGVRALERRLELAARKADPARLEDPLTGLPNRLAAMRRARDEIARARRKAQPMSVALVEIDGFSALAADEASLAERALRLTAETMTQTLRAYDIVGRWGGATFIAVLPEAEIENAVDAMRRVRDRLGEEPSARLGGRAIGVSAGVAVLQPDDATLADIAIRADAALRKAQARGPGMVEAAPGPRSRPGRITSV